MISVSFICVWLSCNSMLAIVQLITTKFFDPFSTNSLYWAHWAKTPYVLGLGCKLGPYNNSRFRLGLPSLTHLRALKNIKGSSSFFWMLWILFLFLRKIIYWLIMLLIANWTAFFMVLWFFFFFILVFLFDFLYLY